MTALDGHAAWLAALLVVSVLTGCNVVETSTTGPAPLGSQATAPTIVTQPEGITVNDGSPASFTVVASGSQPLSYEWLMNSRPVPGGTASTLNIATAVLAQSGAKFSVMVRNSRGGVSSNAATLTVDPIAPRIETQPAAQSVLAGSRASFAVVAGGSAPLTFQWHRNGVAIAGAVGASYVTPATALSDSGALFDVTVTNTRGTVTSNSALLTVAAPAVAPSIVSQPQGASVPLGGAATFTVVAQGTQPLSYQWLRNGIAVAGAAAASYTVSPALLQDNGDSYSVDVSNRVGSVTSQGAVLQVTAPALGIALLAGQLGGSGSINGIGGAARFYNPEGVAVDAAGNVYVADNTRHVIRKVSPAGVVTTIAGLAEIAGSTDGIGNAALFNAPGAVAVDAGGNVYVADTGNDTIRQITPAGVVSTLAGTPGIAGSADGTGGAALFNAPMGIVASGGNLYVADTGNNIIRRIAPGGVVTTLAGTAGVVGAADGTGIAAQFDGPVGISMNGAGNLDVTDTNNNTVREITPAGVATTIAGTAGVFGTLDGPGNVALFAHPNGITVDLAGNLYVTDTGNDTVRMITPALIVSTIAGSGNVGFADGSGRAASFASPSGITADAGGNLYVSDYANDTIRKISATIVVTTLAGTAPHPGAADGAGNAASFDAPEGVAIGASGDLYVADRLNNTIRMVTAAGLVTTFAGTAGVTGSNDGPGSAAHFNAPHYLAVDAAGNIYVADTGNNTIRKITPAGAVSTLAGTPGMAGSADGTGTAALFNRPDGIVAAGGNLYVADTGNNTIRQIAPGGAVTTLAGTPGVTGSNDGTGGAALFNSPHALTVDPAGNIYIADTNNNTIRKMTTGGVVTTLAGTAGAAGAADGTGTAAQFNSPHGLATDGAGNIYVADMLNHTIRVVSATGVVTTVTGVPRSEGVIVGPLPGSLNNPQGIAVLPGSATTLVVTDAAENSVLYVTLP